MVSLENRTIYIGISNCPNCEIQKKNNSDNYFELNSLPRSIRLLLKKQIHDYGMNRIHFPLCVTNGKIVVSSEQNKNHRHTS